MPAELLDLLQEREGWGRETSGGQWGTLFVVTNVSNDGPRSLRAALESPEPLWITFASGLSGVIELSSSILVETNKTLDGRGADVQIRTARGGEPFSALAISGVSQVIISHMRFDDELADWNQDRPGSHAIRVKNAQLVWIHRSSFSRWRSGAVAVAHDPSAPGGMPTHISLTWSKLDQLFQGVTWTGDFVSFGHNWCKRVRQHCLRISGGKAHSHGNLIEQWGAPAIQSAREGAQLYAQGNMFVPGSSNTVNQFLTNGKIKQRRMYAFGDVTFERGADAVPESFLTESHQVGDAPSCEMTDAPCWRAARAEVEGAGP